MKSTELAPEASGERVADTPARPAPPMWRKWALLGVVAATIAAVFATGLDKHVSVTSLVENHAFLRGLVDRNAVLAAALYVAAYAAAVTLSVPGALIFSITGGFLFGGPLGGVLAVSAATLGATGVYYLARTTLGETLARRAGPGLRKLGDGFRSGAWSYMFFLRLVPIFPFWLVNLAPALFNVPVRVFVIATFFGILPSTFAVTVAGSAFAGAIEAQSQQMAACRAAGGTDCMPTLDLSTVVTTELLLALGTLGLLSLVPVLVKAWRRRSAHA